MGKASRDKGARGERQVVQILRDWGFDAHRTGEWKKDDILVPIAGEERVIEVKVRAAGASATLLYEALETGAWACTHKRDRKDWLVTLRFKDLLQLIRELTKADAETMQWLLSNEPDGKDGGGSL